MTAPLRIALADDHAIFRQGVRSLLRREPGMTVVGEAERVDELGALLARTRSDVLLLDLQLDRSSIDAIPDLARAARVLVLTMSEHLEDALAALRAGARGVVFKRFAIATLLEAIRAVAAGQVWLPPAVQSSLLAGLGESRAERLSAREREIVRHVALGERNAEVARRLFISEETVKKHLNTVFHKLGIRDRVELALHAIRNGIVSAHERAPRGRGRRPDLQRKL